MKKHFKFWISSFLVTLFIASCSTSEEEVAALQVDSPAFAPAPSGIVLSDVYLSLKASKYVSGDLIVQVRDKTLGVDIYTTIMTASHYAGNGTDYVKHQIPFSGAAVTLSPTHTYELSVSRSVDPTPEGDDFIYWETSKGDPLIGYNTDHGAKDYVFGLYNIYALESEQTYGGDGYEIGTVARWQEFPSEFTTIAPDQIDLFFRYPLNTNPSGSVIVEIRDLFGNVLGSETIPISEINNETYVVPTATTITFSNHLGLEDGIKYMIAVTRTHPSILGVDEISLKSNNPNIEPNTYPYGNSININGTVNTARDFRFITYFDGSVDQNHSIVSYPYSYSLDPVFWRQQEFVVGAP